MAEFSEEKKSFNGAQLLVRVFYLFLLYSSIVLFNRWWDIPAQAQTLTSLVPTISWVPLVGLSTAIPIIRVSLISASFLATVFPNWRLARILTFIFVLEFVSFYYATLQLDIDWYIWILASFLLIFLPTLKANTESLIQRQKFLLVFWSLIAIDLLTYTMAGIGKILGAFSQILASEPNAFAPKAAALHIANRLIETNQTSILGPFVINHYLLAWPFFLGTIYLLIFSFYISFKPSLHRLWGVGLILFHISNFLVINIGFSAHIFLDALVLIFSPFSPTVFTWKQVVYELPIFGAIIRYLSQRWSI